MKKIFLVFVVVVAGYAGWSHFKKPNFAGTANGGMRSALWDWAHADSDEERYLIANEVVVFDALGAFAKKGNRVPLSEEEETAKQEALDFLEETVNEVREFEKGLSKEDIKEITQDHPDSIESSLSKFSVLKDRDCTQPEYDKLKEIYTTEELGSRAVWVMAYMQAVSRKNDKDFMKRILPLLERKNASALTKIVFNSYGKTTESVKDVAAVFKVEGHEISNYEKHLMDTGLARGDVHKYAFEMTKTAYHCLAKIDMTFTKLLDLDITKAKGEELLGKLKAYVTEHNKFPEDILDIDENYNRLGKANVKTMFHLKKVDDRTIELLTDGEDFEKNTDDDISIGKVHKDS